MSCPDIDRLVEYLTSGRRSDVEVEAHLESCGSCQEEVFLIRELLGSLSPEMEVPESLVQRTLTTLWESEKLPAKIHVPIPQVAASGALGFLTAFLAIMASGTGESSGLVLPLVCSLLVGLGSVFFRGRAGRVQRITEMNGT